MHFPLDYVAIIFLELVIYSYILHAHMHVTI